VPISGGSVGGFFNLKPMENIFNNFDKFLEADQRRLSRIEASRLREENRRMGNACGSCKKWMTSDCQREKNHKVHCNELKCSDFQIDSWTTDLMQRRESEAVNLENK